MNISVKVRTGMLRGGFWLSSVPEYWIFLSSTSS